MAAMYGGARRLIPFTGVTDHKEEGEMTGNTTIAFKAISPFI